jgi:hypothetical protein
MARAHNDPAGVKGLKLKAGHRLNGVLYPELTRFETDHDRKGAMLAVQRTYGATWRYVATIIAFLCGGTALGVATAEGALRLLRPLGLGAGSIVRVLAMFTCVIAALVVLGWLHRNRTRRGLRRILAGRGVPICVSCGYGLTGNVSGICPECGKPIKREGKPA